MHSLIRPNSIQIYAPLTVKAKICSVQGQQISWRVSSAWGGVSTKLMLVICKSVEQNEFRDDVGLLVRG